MSKTKEPKTVVETDNGHTNAERITMIPHGELQPNGWNRKHFKADALSELAGSIKARGIIQPLVVRPLAPGRISPNGGGPLHEIVAGERRWRAAAIADLTLLPCIVRELDERSARELCAIENLQREDLTALEEAQSYRELMDDCGCNIEELESRLGRKRSHIWSRLRLLGLPESVKKAVGEGRIEASVADLIATIPDEKQREAALKEVLKGETIYDRQGDKTVTVPVSVRKVKMLIEEKFRTSLKGAPFDLKQKFEGLPTCEECPKRTGNMEGLPSGSAANGCTDPACYARKVELHASGALAAHKAAGETVLEGDEARKLWSFGYLSYSAPYQSADENHHHKGKAVRVTKLLGKAMPAPVFAVDPEGRVQRLYKKSEVHAAMVKAGYVKSLEREEKESSADKARQERAEATRLLEVRRIIEACMEVVENPKLNERRHALLWAFVERKLLQLYGAGTFEHVRTRRGYAADVFTRALQLPPDADLRIEICRGNAIEMLISDDYGGEYVEDDLADLAKLCAVDTASISRAARKEMEPPKKAAKRKPQPAAKAKTKRRTKAKK